MWILKLKRVAYTLKFMIKWTIFLFLLLTFSFTTSFAHVCTKVSDLHDRNLYPTGKPLQQGYRYHKLLKTFTKFYNRYKDVLQNTAAITFRYNEGYRILRSMLT